MREALKVEKKATLLTGRAGVLHDEIAGLLNSKPADMSSEAGKVWRDSYKEKSDEMDVLLAAMEELDMPEAFKGRSDQFAMIRAMNYDDRVGLTMPDLELCPPGVAVEMADDSANNAPPPPSSGGDWAMAEDGASDRAQPADAKSDAGSWSNLAAPPAPTFSAPVLAGPAASSAATASEAGSWADAAAPPPPPGPPPAVRLPKGSVGSAVPPPPLAPPADVSNVHMQEFYMCAKCGFYTAAKFWKRGTTAKGKEVWYCGLEWPEVMVAFPRHVQALLNMFPINELDQRVESSVFQLHGGSVDAVARYRLQRDVARLEQIAYNVGCGVKFRPFAYGPSCVLEWTGNGQEWFWMPAEPMPEALRNKVDAAKEKFYRAASLVSPETLMRSIPIVLPKCNPLPGAPIPGLGQVDVQKIRGGVYPVLNDASWWLLARSVAANDMGCLSELGFLADSECRKRGLIP
jgi:hypothetical protein